MTPHARRSRAARGWSRTSAKVLGEQLGRNKEFVDRRENGEYDYTPGDLRQIAAKTGVPTEFMTDGWEGVRRVAEAALLERVEQLAADDAENGRTIDPASVAVTMRLLRAALALREGPSAEAQTP